MSTGSPLAARLAAALTRDRRDLDALAHAPPRGDPDALLSRLAVHDLHLAPIDGLHGAERWQHHPALAALKWRLETNLLVQLASMDADAGWVLPIDPVSAMRTVARSDLVPDIYRWVATTATVPQLVSFLA